LHDEAELRAALPKIRLATCSETWTNVSLYKWRKTLLSAAGSAVSDGRYHRAGKAPALYFAKSPIVALAEVGSLAAVGGKYMMAPRAPQIITCVHVEIPIGILDLTDPSNHGALGTSMQELTGSWLLDVDPPTIRLGQVTYSLGIPAIKFPSKFGEKDIEPNLVVFIDHLQEHSGAKLDPHDPESDLPKTVVPLRGP